MTIRRGSPTLSGSGKSGANAGLLAAALNALTASVAIIDARGFIVAVNDAWRRYAEENGMRWPRHGVGYNYLSVLDSAAENGDESLAQIALGIRRVLAGSMTSFRTEYACHTLAGCYFLQHVTAFHFGGVRHAIVAHENITPRKLNEDELRMAKEAAEAGRREEQIRREAAEHRRRIAEAVADMQAIANSGLQLEQALLGIVERVNETADSQAAAIYCAEERWDCPTLMAGSTTLRDSTRKLKSPIAPSILARAIADRRGVCINDVWRNSAASEPDVLAPERQRDYRALLVTPIHRKERLFGYLLLYYTEPREFCDDDFELGQLFGRQVTLALDSAELRSHAEKAAVESERSRLARELHDAVTQTLFSASVVATDMVMPGMGGAAVTRRIKEQWPTTHVLILTSFQETHLVKDALKAGAIGYLLKDVAIDELAQAVRNASRGQTTLHRAATQALIQPLSSRPELVEKLTERQREVLALVARGHSNQEIARELYLGLSTVRFHVSAILAKLGAANRAEAAAMAVRHDLLEPEH